MPEFPHVARLDAGLVLRQLAGVTGTVLTEDGACPGGQVGAVYVRWPDGHRSVLTCQPPGCLAGVRQAEALLATGRAHGVPAPRYELIADLPCATAVIQELLPGSPPAVVDHRTVESMIEVNRRCRGLLAGRGDLPAPSLYLRADGPGFCLHEPLARYDRRTRRLLAAIEEAGARVPECLTGDDLVHLDFHPENVLVDATGGVGRWLGQLLLGAMPEEVAWACWAHMSLRLVDWSIRHLTPADVSGWLETAGELRP